MHQTDHSDTQSSQKMCLQRNSIGACIFSWQIAQWSPAAFTCIEIRLNGMIYCCDQFIKRVTDSISNMKKM